LQRDNNTWISDLNSEGTARENALADLRQKIRSGLPYALSKWISREEPGFDALVEETTQETLIRVLNKLDTFEGKSQFTTWVYKIAVRIALTELRRSRWRDVSLDALMENPQYRNSSKLVSDQPLDPEVSAEQTDMIDRIRYILENELTSKQRQALILVAIQGVPVEEVARRMKTEKNALYKMIHDARLRLKRRLAKEGLSPSDILEVFTSP
jgi:RNA polymerase sigma-70 factor (ECF subfamily)